MKTAKMPKLRKTFSDLLKIWDQRKILNHDFLKKMLKKFQNANSKSDKSDDENGSKKYV